jgi:endonuclease/exonuclease/phosphatase (EEP) superfamily protein YafD
MRSEPKTSNRACRWVLWLAWLNLALVLGLWLFLRQGDDWWPATVALYVPRWPFAVSFVILLPAAVRWPRRVLPPVAVAAVVFAWPVLDAVVNVPRWAAEPASEPSLKVMSLNADGGHFSRGALDALLTIESPDVVAIQESAADLSEPSFWGPGWHVQAGPAGVLIASRFELRPAGTVNLGGLGGRGGAVRCWMECPLGKVMVAAVHLDTPRWGLEGVPKGDVEGIRENIALRDRGSAAVADWLADAAKSTVVAGDFNMTTDSVLYRQYWGSYANCFSEAGFGWGSTKHTRWHGVRIDHVLHGPTLRCTECRVGLDVGSDHRPVIAVLRSSK